MNSEMNIVKYFFQGILGLDVCDWQKYHDAFLFSVITIIFSHSWHIYQRNDLSMRGEFFCLLWLWPFHWRSTSLVPCRPVVLVWSLTSLVACPPIVVSIVLTTDFLFLTFFRWLALFSVLLETNFPALLNWYALILVDFTAKVQVTKFSAWETTPTEFQCAR